MGFSDSSIVVKIALGLGLVAFLFDLIGLASPYWFTQSNIVLSSGVPIHVSYNYLLWRYCANAIGNSRCVDIPTQLKTSSIEAAQALSVIGFLAGCAAVVLIILHVFILNNKIVRLLGLISAFIAAGFILLGVIIIGTADQSQSVDVGWAMILAIIGGILYIITGVMVTIDFVQNKSS